MAGLQDLFNTSGVVEDTLANDVLVVDLVSVSAGDGGPDDSGYVSDDETSNAFTDVYCSPRGFGTVVLPYPS